jgi:condensin-2 complex subunit D3
VSSLLPKALSLLADAAGRLQLGAHTDARQSLVHIAAELAAFDVLAAVLRISIGHLSLLPTS